jgi:EAL domain-containing protein (putative c-di-GMP-specific phosphodiesterase class I)
MKRSTFYSKLSTELLKMRLENAEKELATLNSNTERAFLSLNITAIKSELGKRGEL